MLDWNKCVRSLEGSPARKMMEWKGETSSAEILPVIVQGLSFNTIDPNHLDQLFSWMELQTLQGFFNDFFFLLSVSEILLNLPFSYDDISWRKFTILCNTEGTARTNVSISKQNYLSYIPSKLPFIISLKHRYILKILLIL